MASTGNQFRSLFYRTSLSAGDLLSFDVMSRQVRPLRNLALQYARIFADFKSFSGQGVDLRIQRRIAGRFTGRLGQTIVPQGFGYATRLGNRYYGKIATMKVQNYFNAKQRSNYTYKQNGKVLTDNVKRIINRQSGGRVEQEKARALKKYRQLGIQVEEFSLPELLSDIQYNMLGMHSLGGGLAAPKVTGNLHNSIINRGISTKNKKAIATGTLTVGSSKGNRTRKADQAPYWWKTNYGGYYKWSGERFIPARNFGWLGKSIYGALLHHFPGQTSFEVMVNRKRALGSGYMDFQPPRPPNDSFEISADNEIEVELIATDEVPF